MNRNTLRIILFFGLAFCLAQGTYAQKNKVKGKAKTEKSDSLKTPAPLPGKASVKLSTAGNDSTRTQPAFPDSLREKMIRLANASADSLQGSPPDTAAQKPPKRFYTRVKSDDLTLEEARAQVVLRRIEIAEERLAGYRAGLAAGEKGEFTQEQLDAYEKSILEARAMLQRADSSLLAVREKLVAEGRLAEQAEASEIKPVTGQPDEDDDDGEAADLPDPTAPKTGKGGIKTSDPTPPSKGGKGKLKGKAAQEEDIDNG